MNQVLVFGVSALLLLVGQLEAQTVTTHLSDDDKVSLFDAEKAAAHLQLNASQVSQV